MRTFKTLRGMAVAACVAVGFSSMTAIGAMASTLKVCIPEKESTAVVTPKAGLCKPKYTEAVLLQQAEQEKVQELLPYIKITSSGVGGKPTIQFTGVNVQIVSGASSDTTINGEGNLVIGNDEAAGEQTGSDNLVLGAGQTYTSYGSLLGGFGNIDHGAESVLFGSDNKVTAALGSVTGGYLNLASGDGSSVSGGYGNTASVESSSVGGGQGNTASGDGSSVSGGYANTAGGLDAWAGGGEENRSGNVASSVAGGHKNKADEVDASVTGGSENEASGADASVSGGSSNVAKASDSSVSGGMSNKAEGEWSSILGGQSITLTAKFSVSP